MADTILKRKAYDTLLEWKNDRQGETAILIKGARRTGKSFLVRQFAKNEYRTAIIIDFMKLKKRIKDAFDNDAEDLDLLFDKLSLEYKTPLYPRESVIVFDEVELFPRARELIKIFVEDGRYDFIETGSLLSIEENVRDILIPSEEEELMLHPLDFEEFLWATGDTSSYPLLKKFYDNRQPLGESAHKVMMDTFRRYMIIGGMPAVVKEYVTTGDLRKVDSKKREIITLYRTDCTKYAGEYKITVRKMFDSIPSQLNKKGKRYNVGAIGLGSKDREATESYLWLDDSKVVNLCFNATDPEVGLSMYKDEAQYKMYMADTGLLITHTVSELNMDANSVYADLLMDKLNLNEGMFIENLVCQMLNASGHALYYYSRSNPNDRKNEIEVDFLVMRNGKICPVEVKSSSSTKHVSLDKFIKRFGKRIGQPFILCTKDITENDGILYLPLYMASLLRSLARYPRQEINRLGASDFRGKLRQADAPALVELHSFAVVIEHPEHEYRQGIPGKSGVREQVVGLVVVHRHPGPRIIHHSEGEHRIRIAAFHGCREHLRGEFRIAFDPFAVQIPQTDEV